MNPVPGDALTYIPAVGSFDAVLFDFGHTLFDSVPASQHCRRYEDAHGVTVDDEAFAVLWREIQARSRTPDELAKGRDLNPELHEACWVSLFAPLDELAPGLAGFVYAADVSAAGWRPYPDAQFVMQQVKEWGLSIGVVSNTGWDIRAVFRHYQLDQYVDGFVLSCDHGVVKPDVALFEIAIAELGVAPERTLMVGDHPVADAAPAEVGVTCLILPRIDRTERPALGTVLALTGP